MLDNEKIEVISLVQKLRSPVPAIREEARRELTESKRSHALNVLIRMLSEEENEDDRVNTIENLILVPEEEGNRAIIQTLLNDPSPLVREKAAGALGRLKYKESIEHLIKALKDSDKKVILKSAWSLGEFKDEKTLPAFKELIETTEDQEIKRQVKLTFSRAFPDVRVIDDKFLEEQKKTSDRNTHKVMSFFTSWKLWVAVVAIIVLIFFVRLVSGTSSFSLTKPELTKEQYIEKIMSLEKRKDTFRDEFMAVLEKIYVQNAENMNEAERIEISKCGDGFSSLRREMEDFTSPPEYKEINEQILKAIAIYEETSVYAGNVYTPVKFNQTLSYKEVKSNVEKKLKEGDDIFAGAIENLKGN